MKTPSTDYDTELDANQSIPLAVESHPEVYGDEGEEDGSDDPVHGKECGVEPGKIFGRDERMFPGEKRSYGKDSNPAEERKIEENSEPDQEREHEEVHDACGEKGSIQTDGLGNAVQLRFAVVLKILAGIEDIETADPERDGCSEDEMRTSREPRMAIHAAGGRGRERSRGRDATSG